MIAIRAALMLYLAPIVWGQTKPTDLNTLRTFPPIDSKADWKKRANEIREHVLVSCGLWPLPPKTPLNAKVFDRVERDRYSIEKVYFQSYPNFYVAGNLYRPLGKGNGPFPAILNPHGHWRNGRMADEETGSIAARCINFARQGMIAFSYDMVGYNDSRQVDHKFASNPTNLLWNISLMGLQTWNSIRALDFLESLPGVDKKRLACTGESGGGTQTFMLGAIDDRLAVQAPIVMVSHSMQGGCLCENAPGLRVDYSNMEIAAAPAPRPQIVVAATGDWTKKTMEVEGPAIESIYKLLGAKDRFDFAIFDYPHNYNRTTREEVYAFFGKRLLKSDAPSQEQSYKKEPDADLIVFPKELPQGALGENEFIQQLVELYRNQLREGSPRSYAPLWEHALQLQHVRFAFEDSRDGEKVLLTREPENMRVQLTVPEGKGPIAILLGEHSTLPDMLDGIRVVRTDIGSNPAAEDQFKNHFSTYNRTWLQAGVADVKAVAEYLKKRFPRAKLVLVADARTAGIALASAPLVDAVVADCSTLADADDASLLRPETFFPGIRRLGSFDGILALAKAPALLHGVSDKLLGTRGTRRSSASAKEIAEFISMSTR
jgi:dienelactone hydrolase